LSEIAESNRSYDAWVTEQSAIATSLYQINGVKNLPGLLNPGGLQDLGGLDLENLQKNIEEGLHPDCKKLVEAWPALQKKYAADNFEYRVRDKVINSLLPSPP
jgi:methylmalonyl-CoA mutase